MMLILTSYIGFDVAFTSVFIIVCNVLGTISAAILSKYGKNLSVGMSAFIKYGLRGLMYLIAFIINKNIVFIIAIVFGFIACRILEDKVTGTFLKTVDENNQFLYGNMRYFIASLGEGIGAFIAGILISKSLGILFLGASIFTIIQTIILICLSKLKNSKKSCNF